MYRLLCMSQDIWRVHEFLIKDIITQSTMGPASISTYLIGCGVCVCAELFWNALYTDVYHCSKCATYEYDMYSLFWTFLSYEYNEGVIVRHSL